jgi:adenosylcobinamide-GDP ribazoletransferase
VTALRLSLGLLTIIPVGHVSNVDRRAARGAMLWAPVVGVIVGGISAVVLVGVHTLIPTTLGAVLASALAVGALAYLTRGLHLDGLADTTDALGSGRAAPDALDIARRGDVGPFGVVAIVLVLLIQVAALAVAVDLGWGAVAVVTAVVTGRLAVVISCARGIPAARSEGLGALVAGVVPRGAALAWLIAVPLGALALGAWLTPSAPWALPLSVVVGVTAASALLARAVRRLGGITGDVLGAAVETATAMCLVAIAIGASVSA